jgi:hypothetical protein
MRPTAICRLVTASAGMCLLSWFGTSQAALDDLTLVALSETDARAVIRTAEGELQVIKAGERLPGTDMVVKQILHSRLVLEQTVQGPPPAKELVWITLDGKGRSRIQRLHRKSPEKSVELPPQISPAVGMGSSR